MDPITTSIVAALAVGVASSAKEVGQKVLVDAYDALKAAIKNKYGIDSNIAKAVTKLEEEPDFEPNQTALADRVEQAKAAEDTQIQELAQKLRKALESTQEGKEAVSKYKVRAEQIGVVGDETTVEGGIHFGAAKQ